MRLHTRYLWFQAAAVVAWWIVLGVAPQARAYFLPTAAAATYLWAFLPGDLLLVAGASAHAALAWQDGVAPASFWIAAGALWFGTAYLVALAILGGVGWTGAVLMLAASLCMAALSRSA